MNFAFLYKFYYFSRRVLCPTKFIYLSFMVSFTALKVIPGLHRGLDRGGGWKSGMVKISQCE